MILVHLRKNPEKRNFGPFDPEVRISYTVSRQDH